MKRIVIITGLTASGKSGLAVKIAKEYNGEIISADSVQIYRDLNIGSAKESKATMQEIPHHLIDIRNANENYNVGEFVVDVCAALSKIEKKGKLPIIVGGTGMYIKALLEGYSLGSTEGHDDFRKKYQELAEKQGNISVWEELNKLNPEKAKSVHFNNLKRVIRYLEIEEFGSNQATTESILKDYDICAVGIVAERELIYSRINARVDEMIAEGLEQEVSKLYNSGIKRENQSVTSIGYREWFDYFEGKTDKSTTIDLIKQHTRNYCKRQLTFLKNIQGIYLLNLEQAENKIKEFLND